MRVFSEHNILTSIRPKFSSVMWFWTSLLIFLVAFSYAIWFYYWDISRLLEYGKCPACYGETLCDPLLTHPDFLNIYYFGYFGWIVNTITTKNVYRGSLNSVEVIVKRLGHESELKVMDTILCKKIPNLCLSEFHPPPDLYNTILKDIQNLLSNKLMNGLEVKLLQFCPSLENLHPLLKTLDIVEDNPKSLSRLANIWTLLHVNAEPLVLQIFPQEEGWPFPQYLGACGRIIVESFEGNSLVDSYTESWETRARLSLQLLEAVDRFTLHSPDFALYLLDYSADNVAVDTNQKVSFVDLEHTIIVDKHSSLFTSGRKNTIHHTGTLCKDADCSYFSPDDICQHPTSDFNHYMLCREILAPSDDPYVALPSGLLHSAPENIHQKYPLYESALGNCSSDSNINHMLPAQILRDILRAEVGYHRPGKIFENRFCNTEFVH